MQITVISVTQPEWKSKGKAKWQEVTLSYKSDKGDKEKKFLSFNEIYKDVASMQAGETYEVRLQKDGDYWQWVAVEKIEGQVAPTKATGGGNSGNSWVDRIALDRERFEFEKDKQILIIRQSMIASATTLGGPNASPNDVIEMADVFVNYVLNGLPEKKKPGRPKKVDDVEAGEPDVE